MAAQTSHVIPTYGKYRSNPATARAAPAADVAVKDFYGEDERRCIVTANPRPLSRDHIRAAVTDENGHVTVAVVR